MSTITIMELNEDCWRLVLEHVPVRDIIRTERTSRQWQRIVLRYLIGCRISVKDISFMAESAWDDIWNVGCHPELWIRKYDSFQSWTKKLGSSVVAAVCDDPDTLLDLTENCPNLQNLFFRWREEIPWTLEKLNNIQRLGIYDSWSKFAVSDACVSKLIGDKALIQLEAHGVNITGEFLNAINTSNLKLLAFDGCEYLESQYLLPITGLTRLKLTDVTVDISDVEAMLENQPDLEWLELQPEWADISNRSKALYKLTRLKYLNVNLATGDEEVDSITRSCKELQELTLTDCECLLSSAGIEAICRNAGTRLTMLHLEYVDGIDDDDLITIIRCCPKLELLKLSVGYLSPDVTQRAAAARAEVCGFGGAGGAGDGPGGAEDGPGGAGAARMVRWLQCLRLELTTYLPRDDSESDDDENLESSRDELYEDLFVTWHYYKN